MLCKLHPETVRSKAWAVSGITLVALVVTIIVLLILAGVTLNLVMGENGILGRAESSAKKHEEATAKEQAELLIAEYQTTYFMDEDSSSDTLKDYIKAQIGAGQVTTSGDYFVTVDDKYEIAVYSGNKAVGKSVRMGKIEDGGKITWNDSSVIAQNPEPEPEVVATSEKTLTKNSNDNSTGNEKLELSEGMQEGGVWESEDSNIVSVDDSGNVEWKAIGKAQVTYTASGKREIFDIICNYAIVCETDGWNVSSDIRSDQIIYGSPTCYSISKYWGYVWACTEGNTGVYHVTIWRPVDLTNVRTIEYVGGYWRNGNYIAGAYKSGIVESSLGADRKLNADCTYKEGYSRIVNNDTNGTVTSFSVIHDVSDLLGEHILAFTSTHSNQQHYSNLAGYTGNILLKP